MAVTVASGLTGLGVPQDPSTSHCFVAARSTLILLLKFKLRHYTGRDTCLQTNPISNHLSLDFNISDAANPPRYSATAAADNGEAPSRICVAHHAEPTPESTA